ncbi:MAG: site-specific integrase [Alphaproteobacteria bacterium]
MAPTPDPRRRILPFTEWPNADRTAWESMTRKAGLFENPVPAASWRPATSLKHKKAYGRWLGDLERRDSGALHLEPAARITEERVEAYLVELQSLGLASRTLLNYAVTLLVMAKGHAPGQDWSWLETVVRRLQADAKPVRSVTARLRPVDEIFRAALGEMAAAETRKPRLPTDQSSWFRDALMIAILASRALRLKELWQIRLEEHLIREEDCYRLRFRADEIKTGKAYDAYLPRALTPYIERYLADHRPRLLQGADTVAMWISNQGKSMHIASIAKQIRALTKRLFGIVINPHTFRQATATSKAYADPKNIHDLASVLHHTTPRTSERHYNMTGSLIASRSHVATVLKRSAKLKHLR